MSARDEDLIDFAKARADECWRAVGRCQSLGNDYRALNCVTERYGIKPPPLGPNGTLPGAIKRLCDEHWWRRQIRRQHGRTVEGFAIGFGYVHKHAGLYASNEAVARRKEQKKRTAQLLCELEAVNEEDQCFTLSELAERSVSNPRYTP